jgi:hypothetical protein
MKLEHDSPGRKMATARGVRRRRDDGEHYDGGDRTTATFGSFR